jgi:hypothetical protein
MPEAAPVTMATLFWKRMGVPLGFLHAKGVPVGTRKWRWERKAAVKTAG